MTTPASKSKLPLAEELTAKKERRSLGSLSGKLGAKKMELPLAGIDISAKIIDRAASVTIKQKFRNPYKDFLEATFIFPLAGGIAVDRFEMRVGDRVLVGNVEERQEARKIYAQALEAGKRTALLEQERDDVFTVSVGNLVPGEEVEITLTYSERLPYFASGKTELRLPLVVAPRYIAGNPLASDPVGKGIETDTDVVPDASRISPPRLVPGVDPSVSLNIQVELCLDSADSLADLTCSQHATSTSISDGAITVTLSRTDELLNRDFVLNWRLAASEIKSRLYLLPDTTSENDHFGMLSIVPPLTDSELKSPRDIVFVFDRSGSMGGLKIVSAARACSLLLESLTPADRFAIATFDSQIEWLGGSSIGIFYEADEGGLERGHKFLHEVFARGGTELDPALSSVLDSISNRADQSREPIVVLLTDGEIGDESRVLKQVQKQAQNVRIFTLGIDTAVNSGFLKRLAQVGRGTCALVQPGDQLVGAVSDLAREIGVPLVTDIQLSCENDQLVLSDLTPSPTPDLYAGRAVNLFFRAKGKVDDASISIKGKRIDGAEFAEVAQIVPSSVPAIAKLWAKSFVMSLEDSYREGTGDQTRLKTEIVNLAKTHQLLTKFTAFVLVDEQAVNKDGTRRAVVQPVHEPALWETPAGTNTMSAFAGGSGASARYGAPMAAPTSQPRSRGSFDLFAQSQSTSASTPPLPPGSAWGDAMPPAPPPGGSWSSGMPPAPNQSWHSGIPPQPQSESEPLGANPADNLLRNIWASMRQNIAEKEKSILAPLTAKWWQDLSILCAAVDEDQSVSPDDLKKSSEALLQAIIQNQCAHELPQLVAFLKLEVKDLIEAVATSQSRHELKDKSRKCQNTFTLVEVEIRQQLAVTDPNQGNFWEANV